MVNVAGVTDITATLEPRHHNYTVAYNLLISYLDMHSRV